MVGEVHFYSAELDGGLTLFDTGPPTPEGEACLMEQIDLKRLKYLFITHCHVDHYGLVNFVIRHSDAEIFVPRRDVIKLRRHGERMERMGAILQEFGFDEEFSVQLKESFQKNKVFPITPERFKIVEESGVPAELGISYLPCPGHSQSDLVYLVGNAAVTGDVLLRNIFQAPLLDIDLDTFSGRFRNYNAYCDSLRHLTRLRGMRIMPGHRHDIDGVDETIIYYVTTLLERVAQLAPFRDLPMSIISERLFMGRLVEPFFIYLKVSELVFMLDFLDNPGLLKTSLEQTGLFEVVRTLFEAVT
jgi:2,4-dienoyl-CoA reductase (NADPH2)